MSLPLFSYRRRMMDKVQRWEPEHIPELQTFNMRPDNMGCFVLFNDYKQQAETIERLKSKPKLYRHIKTGGLYEFISDAEMENNLQDVVVYQSVEHKTVWVRPSTEFYDGRFEEVTKLEAGEL